MEGMRRYTDAFARASEVAYAFKQYVAQYGEAPSAWEDLKQVGFDITMFMEPLREGEASPFTCESSLDADDYLLIYGIHDEDMDGGWGVFNDGGAYRYHSRDYENIEHWIDERD
jgi:hypothetical protein